MHPQPTPPSLTMWLVGALFAISTGLTGVVYSNVSTQTETNRVSIEEFQNRERNVLVEITRLQDKMDNVMANQEEMRKEQKASSAQLDALVSSIKADSAKYAELVKEYEKTLVAMREGKR